MDQEASNQEERGSASPAAAGAPAGMEDLPSVIPETAELDVAPASAQIPAADSGRIADGVQQEALVDAKEAPAAQSQTAAADSQQGAHADPEPRPTPGTAADNPAVPQPGAEPARQQTGAGKKKKSVVLKKVGTQWVEQKKLKQSEVEALAERLSKSRPLPPPEKRTRAVRLTYTHDKKSKTYLPKLVPAKTTTAEEQTEYMVSLAARCAESEERKQRMLEAKYLQPLTKPKRIRKKSMEGHIAKMEKLYQGQPTG